ncbi:MAG: hypothetical protein WC777_05180 [Candidatus Gracilibacteria bacterium]|jgi:hypothetical protein
MNARINNLTVDQPKVRAGDVRVSPQMFEQLREVEARSAEITGILLKVMNSAGVEEAIFDGGFLACKDDGDSTSSTSENLTVRKEEIAGRLVERIVRDFTDIPADQLVSRHSDDRNPLVVFSAQDLEVIGFSLYDKYLEGWMSYEQVRRGREHMGFMDDVFAKVVSSFEQTSRGSGSHYSLYLLPSKRSLSVFLRHTGQGFPVP